MKLSTRALSILVLIVSNGLADETARPAVYPLELPVADRFCVPVRSTFAEAGRSESVVRGKRIQHRRNGGFGVPIEKPGAPRHLVHTGADVGWWQVREPVFAMADGIVRMSTGPEFKRASNEQDSEPRDPMPWGNLIVIEHRIGESDFATSIYGHLGADRRVKVGERVKVGQPIGTIGRKHYRINGGYDPHLHFGIRQGRNAQQGAVLLDATNGWRGPPVRMLKVNQQTIELQCEQPIYVRWQLTMKDKRWNLRFNQGRATAPTQMMWDWQRANFNIEGYAVNTDGWYDPIKFLRERNAVVNPGRLR